MESIFFYTPYYNYSKEDKTVIIGGGEGGHTLYAAMLKLLLLRCVRFKCLNTAMILNSRTFTDFVYGILNCRENYITEITWLLLFRFNIGGATF